MSDDRSDFQFSPLPTPHAMKWDNLMPPVKRAVRDLLMRINGAEKTRKELCKSDKEKELGNCFLVCGSRGTGKTTVLFSAQDAVLQDSSFFENTDYGEEARENLQEKSLKETARQLCTEGLRRNIIWLDILDLEPLPETANLLTTLLTRVRKAFESCDRKNEGAALTSIFEEGEESAMQQLGYLINDATLMWENIKEMDTRDIASRQIKAADIYASFRGRFKKAMDKISEELGHHRGLHKEGCSIVLPIDNIDRSTDHLRSIVKLAQIVSHRRLWLVMAGDRVEVEAFLERVYWKELIHSQYGGDARGKMRAGGEDETLVMARRQAIAIAQRLWPTTHRVEIHKMTPEESLNFRPPDKNDAQTVYEMLAEVTIPTTSEQRKKNRSQIKKTDRDKKNDEIRLIELFDIYDKAPQLFRPSDIKNASSLISQLQKPSGINSKISEFIRGRCFEGKNEDLLESLKTSEKEKCKSELAKALNAVIRECDFWNEKPCKNMEIKSKLRMETKLRAKQKTKGNKANVAGFNRMILEDLYPEEIKKSSSYLTQAAQDGLTLSSRSLLDLWQLAHWVVNDSAESPLDFRAEKIARSMLRNAISGSKMSSAMGQCLQDDIIRRSKDKGTVIFFGELALQQSHLRVPGITVFQKPTAANKQFSYNIRSKLMVGSIEDVALSLKREQPSRKYDTDDKNTVYENKKPDIFPQPFIIANESEEQIEELPPLVSAWLTILYDILTMAEQEVGSTVITSKFEPPQGIVEVCHEVIIKSKNCEKLSLTLGWPLPKLRTFWAYDVFRRQWQNFQKSVREIWPDQARSEDLSPRLLAAGWTTCVLETFKAFNPIFDSNLASSENTENSENAYMLIDELSGVKGEALRSCYKIKVGNTEKTSIQEKNEIRRAIIAILKFDQKVMEAAAILYSEIITKMESTSSQQSADVQGLRVQMRDWLENKLPWLMSYLYVPSKIESLKNSEQELSCCEELVEHIKDQELAKYWEDNWPFILYDFETELLKRIPEDIKKWNEGDQEQPFISEHQKCRNCLEQISLFNDLHQVWGDKEDKKTGEPQIKSRKPQRDS